MKRLLMLGILAILLAASASTVFAGKDFNHLKPCTSPSTDQYSVAYNKKTGYTTYSYFDENYNYLGMEQYYGETKLIDTYDGDCGIPN